MSHRMNRSRARFWAHCVSCVGIVVAFGCDDRPSAKPPSAPRVAPGVPRPRPVPSRYLMRDGDEFVHGPAQVRVRLPEDWRAIEEPTDQGAIAILKLAGEIGVRATLSIAPLERDRELGEVAFNEAGALRLLKTYGPDQVADPVRDSPAGKPGWRIDIAPPAGGGERGVMWLFAARPDSASPWRVKLRATLSAGTTADRLEPLIAAIALPDVGGIEPRPSGSASSSRVP